MSYAKELLDLGTTPLGLDATAVADAIVAAADCEQACTTCADLCLAEEDVAALAKCVALCTNCADVCATTLRVLSRPVQSDHAVVHHALRACVRACKLSGDECAMHAPHHEHCAICERPCRACERACAKLLEAEAFEALNKLAGA
jgi:hypothetical protein